jgi:pentatricopeptide repeat protein
MVRTLGSRPKNKKMADVQKDVEKPEQSRKKRRRGGKRGGVKHRRGHEGDLPHESKNEKNGDDKSNKKNRVTGKQDIPTLKSKLVNRFKEKSEVIAANQLISQHAQRKQLSQAVECFESLRKSGDANTHSYAAVIHAYVRCGDVFHAHQRLKEMKGAGLKPCVVCYTSLLKGLCDGKIKWCPI